MSELLDVAREERDEAMYRAEAGADADWKDAARQMVHDLAARSETFTSDDIWDAGLETPREPRALGPVLIRAVADGWIRGTGEYAPSHRRHVAPLPVWESLINPNYAPHKSKAYAAFSIRQDELDTLALQYGKSLSKKDYAEYARAIGERMRAGFDFDTAAERALFGIGTPIDLEG